jgi:hypothetical protein
MMLAPLSSDDFFRLDDSIVEEERFCDALDNSAAKCDTIFLG